VISRLHGHMSAIRSTKSVPGAHLIGGESRSASQSLSTRTKFGDQQYKRFQLKYMDQNLSYEQCLSIC